MPSITTTDGVRLDYLEYGQRTGRPVVLIAGFRAPATSWRYQVPALVEAGFRVIAFDRRGHGTSERPAYGHSMRRHGADLHELLVTLDLRSAVLVGGSMGGSVVWSMFSRYGTTGVAGAVIIDQTPKMLNAPDWPYGFYDYDAANADTAFAEGIPDPGRFTILSKGPVRIGRLLKAAGPIWSRNRTTLTPDELQLLNDHVHSDWRSTIAAVDVPMLLVAGSEGELWPAEHAAAAATLSPVTSSVLIPQDGHAAHIEQPSAFNAVLASFLATLR